VLRLIRFATCGKFVKCYLKSDEKVPRNSH
jgi:hypothetical protein